MATKYWLQHHKYDELGSLPDNFIIHTSKDCCQKATGDPVFMIVGGHDLKEIEEKIGIELPVKQSRKGIYILWQKFYIKRVQYLKDEQKYEIAGKNGQVFAPPILLDSPEFDEFRKHYMTSGFINITQAAYLRTLRELTGEKLPQQAVKPIATAEQKAKVPVPLEVYQNLQSISHQKAVKMLDVTSVLQHSRKLGLFHVAQWIEANRNDYLKGTVNGFLPD